MTIQVSAAIIISVLSLSFSVFMGLKSDKRTDTKDIEERVKENTRINMKLDTILDTINEMAIAEAIYGGPNNFVIRKVYDFGKIETWIANGYLTLNSSY